MKITIKSGLLITTNLLLISLLLFSATPNHPANLEDKSTTELMRGAEPFIGEISMFAGNFAPRGWALCNGQLLPIAQNSALFSLLGTTYGGDGRTTFALPDLRGRVASHAGSFGGRGPNYRLGQKGVKEILIKSPDSSGESTSKEASNPYLVVNYIISLSGIFPSRN
jgi:microcystin-dependent protein